MQEAFLTPLLLASYPRPSWWTSLCQAATGLGGPGGGCPQSLAVGSVQGVDTNLVPLCSQCTWACGFLSLSFPQPRTMEIGSPRPPLLPAGESIGGTGSGPFLSTTIWTQVPASPRTMSSWLSTGRACTLWTSRSRCCWSCPSPRSWPCPAAGEQEVAQRRGHPHCTHGERTPGCPDGLCVMSHLCCGYQPQAAPDHRGASGSRVQAGLGPLGAGLGRL